MKKATSRKKPIKRSASGKAVKAKVIPLESAQSSDAELKTLLQQALDAQKNNDLPLAEKLYREHIAQKGFEAPVYTRLMIILRKQKKYKEELQLVEKAIKLLEEQYARQYKQRKVNRSVHLLSTRLNKSLGLTDKEGKAVFKPQQLLTWEKRKATLEKRLKKGK